MDDPAAGISKDSTGADGTPGMIDKGAVNHAIDALVDSMEARVSLTLNLIRLTLAESKLAFQSLVLTIVLGIIVLMLLGCTWLVLQMLLFSILTEYLALGSVQSLLAILTLHLVLISVTGLVIQRLCRNLTFRHLREATAPVTPPQNASHTPSATDSSIDNAQIKHRAQQKKGNSQ